MVDNVGSWLSYVATLELVEAYSGGSGLAISAVVIIRFLPSLLLAPVCGVVADRCVCQAAWRAPRGGGRTAAGGGGIPAAGRTSVAHGLLVGCLPWPPCKPEHTDPARLQGQPGGHPGVGRARRRAGGGGAGGGARAAARPGGRPLRPAHPAVQRHRVLRPRWGLGWEGWGGRRLAGTSFPRRRGCPTPACIALHPPANHPLDPRPCAAARKALVPVLVPVADLHLATTIDSFAWSITGAVGASAGGVLASRLGVSACFMVVCGGEGRCG